MSVLIKGMEMPSDCEKCPFLDYEEGFCFASGIKGKSGWYEYVLRLGGIKDGRHDDCPLVPVPPADVVERKKGKWEDNTKDESWKCSECGFIFYSVGFYNIYNTKFRMRFCPNCGADMREES